MNYADSSFLFSLYLPELQSEAARDLLLRSNTGLWFTPLHRAEWEHAVSQNVFRGVVSEAEALAARAALESDFTIGVLEEVAMPPAAWAVCADMARKRGSRMPMRTLDTLHVACALELGAAAFWTFDRQQAVHATHVGLKVQP